MIPGSYQRGGESVRGAFVMKEKQEVLKIIFHW